jgi:cell division protein FtsA
VSEAVHSAVVAAERMAGISLESAVVGIGCAEGANARGVYEFGRPRQVELDDLGYAVRRAMQVHLGGAKLIVQICPQDFTVDGRSGYRNPKGVRCSRLEANVHIVATAEQEHQFLISAVHQAHLAVEDTVFEGIAAAYAAILPEDRARGVALIDVGAQSTEMAVYDGDALQIAASVPIGGEHFTRDIAWCLSVSFDDADLLKCEYGCAILGLTADGTLIEVPSENGRAGRETTRRQINEILEARAEELFLYVRNHIARCGMEQGLLEGAVLTGGGARLNGMCDIAERILNCPARNGLPVGIMNWPEEINHPGWATAAGLAMYSARLRLKKEPRRRAPGLLGLVK